MDVGNARHRQRQRRLEDFGVSLSRPLGSLRRVSQLSAVSVDCFVFVYLGTKK
jgi:hypothetical protein